MDSIIYLSPIKNTNNKGNTKYSIKDYIIGIIDICKNNTSWNSYCGYMKGDTRKCYFSNTFHNNILEQNYILFQYIDTLRKKYNEWNKMGIFEYGYNIILNKYLNNTRKTEELKCQSIDSTFIEDINGCKESSYDGIHKKRKGELSKGIKITTIVTNNGIPLSVNIDSANRYDSTLLIKAVNNRIINCNTNKYRKHNRYKQYFLGDKGKI